MSSIYSDPFFRRGSTLLTGETIEIDPGTGLPVAGNEVVGQIKAFQDVNPVGRGERWSNRLVYCVAARYVGTTDINVLGADRGKFYTFARRDALDAFSDLASPADIAEGRIVGVLDEYLTETVRPNDIVWLVVKGPATVAKANPGVIPGSFGVEVNSTGGTAVIKAQQANLVGTNIDPAIPVSVVNAVTAGANPNIDITVPTALLRAVYGPTATLAALSNTALVGSANIPTGAYVGSITTVGTSGTNSTATVPLVGTTTGTLAAGLSLFLGGPLRTATTCRVQVINASI